MTTNQMTDRQKKSWPRVIHEVNKAISYIDYMSYGDISEDIHYWIFDYQEGYEPGRGKNFQAVLMDSSVCVWISMDIYGNYDFCVGEMNWYHIDNTDCECGYCIAKEDND